MTSLVALSHVTDHLDRAARFLRSPAALQEAATMEPEDAGALVASLLQLAGYLDDSVSTDPLGSLFDRTTASPVNHMRAAIAAAYRVPDVMLGTTGTSALNAAVMMTLGREGHPILVGRDSHVSINAGVVQSGARPLYYAPPFHDDAGVLLPAHPADIEPILDAHRDITSVVITYPTYHGLAGDLDGIVSLCHGRGVRVFVDEAHGPHLAFLRELGFPLAAEAIGADVVTQSTHKVLSALNQASLVLFNDPDLLPRYEECQAFAYQSTSFSYLLLASLEFAIHQMQDRGVDLWRGAVERADALRERAARIEGVRPMGREIIDNQRVLGLDPTRVTLDVRGTGLTGYQVSDALSQHGIVTELASPDVVLFLFSPAVPDDAVDRIGNAIENIAAGRRAPVTRAPLVPPRVPEQVLTPREAYNRHLRVRLPREQAIGRISAETIGAYPPGQAVIVAGERITAEAVDYLVRVVAEGGHLKRVADDHFRTIQVIADLS